MNVRNVFILYFSLFFIYTTIQMFLVSEIFFFTHEWFYMRKPYQGFHKKY